LLFSLQIAFAANFAAQKILKIKWKQDFLIMQ